MHELQVNVEQNVIHSFWPLADCIPFLRQWFGKIPWNNESKQAHHTYMHVSVWVCVCVACVSTHSLNYAYQVLQ